MYNIYKIMKKSPSVWEMLQKQNLSCPACGKLISKAKLNSHLDSECSSSSGQQRSLLDEIKPIEVKIEPTIKTEMEIDESNSSLVDVKNIKNAHSLKSAFNTCAPWRSQSTKRKFSNMSPSKIATSKTNFTMSVNSSANVNSKETSTKQKKNAQEFETPEFWDNIDSVDFADELKDMKSNDSHETYVPYYIANFKHVLEKVLDDDFYNNLFDESDRNYVQSFHSLSESAQKLYVRLFQRKYKWLRLYQINYPQIAQDVSEYLNELVNNKFLSCDTRGMELETALKLSSLPEAKNLSKQFNFNACGKNKVEIIDLLLKHAKQHKSLFFSSGKNGVSHAILKKVLEVLGPCYILELEPKRLFTRILMLFSLPTMAEDDEEAAGGQQQQLLTLLQVNKGDLMFPNYTMCRKCLIFETRDDLIRYEVARQHENDILNAIEDKKFDDGKKLYLESEEKLAELVKEGYTKRDGELPFHLRRYTAAHVYTRCLNQGVEILQKLRQYKEAIQLLKKLVEQDDYCLDRRGKWYDRLALNLDQHLKQHNEAADVLIRALKDINVRVGPRWALLTRAKRIFKLIRNEELTSYVEEMANIVEAPKVVISGRLLPRPIPGRRHIFISSNANDDPSGEEVTILSVEQLAIEHYKNNGYGEGVHGEGSTFISLYALFFWDIIYDGSIPDVFISPYQSHPLDLNSNDFYDRRKDQIDCQLATIKNLTNDALNEILLATWTAHLGQSSLVNWDLFKNAGHAMSLVKCLGSPVLVGICERLAKDFRFTRSGVPDLVVWNPDLGLAKIVEVKGPGDKLSPKQILWLDYLLKLGTDTEVCLVEAEHCKKLRRT